jgi:hypothetical protein
MSDAGLLVGLLVLAWAGDTLARPAHRPAFSGSAGTAFLLGGVLLGPLGMGAVSRDTLALLSPLTLVGASWLGLLAGARLGYSERRRATLGHLALGVGLAGLTFAACAALGWALAARLFPGHDDAARFLALGLGAAGSETARLAVARGAHPAAPRGPLLDALADLAEGDDVVPLLGLAVLFALGPQPAGTVLAHEPALALVLTAGLGLCLGAIAAALTRVEARDTERWGILLGAALMGVGLSSRLGLAAPAALFVMGLALNQLADDAVGLRGLLERTGRPVLLPVVALAGASLDLRDGAVVWLVAAAVPLARALVKVPVAGALRDRLADGGAASRWVGLALLPSGGVTVCVGLTVAERFDGPIGRLVLAGALASVAVGEALGAPALRRELRRAGAVDA